MLWSYSRFGSPLKSGSPTLFASSLKVQRDGTHFPPPILLLRVLNARRSIRVRDSTEGFGLASTLRRQRNFDHVGPSWSRREAGTRDTDPPRRRRLSWRGFLLGAGLRCGALLLGRRGLSSGITSAGADHLEASGQAPRMHSIFVGGKGRKCVIADSALKTAQVHACERQNIFVWPNALIHVAQLQRSKCFWRKQLAINFA
jgi:hypothetical protein